MPRRYDLGDEYNGRGRSNDSGGAWFFWLLAGAVGGWWLSNRVAGVSAPVAAPAAQNGSEPIQPMIDVTPKTRPIEFVGASNFWIDKRIDKSEPHYGESAGEDELYPYLGDSLDVAIDSEADFGGIPTSIKQADLTVKGYLPVK
jgi:hypothetical protein